MFIGFNSFLIFYLFRYNSIAIANLKFWRTLTLEAMFIGFNAALARQFSATLRWLLLACLLASVVGAALIGEKLPHQFGIAPYEHSFLVVIAILLRAFHFLKDHN